MTLYLYNIGETVPRIIIEHVSAYSTDRIITEEGETFGPLAEDVEFSATPDCSGTLRAEWSMNHPTMKVRLEEVEALLAGLLFGGVTE